MVFPAAYGLFVGAYGLFEEDSFILFIFLFYPSFNLFTYRLFTYCFGAYGLLTEVFGAYGLLIYCLGWYGLFILFYLGAYGLLT